MAPRSITVAVLFVLVLLAPTASERRLRGPMNGFDTAEMIGEPAKEAPDPHAKKPCVGEDCNGEKPWTVRIDAGVKIDHDYSDIDDDPDCQCKADDEDTCTCNDDCTLKQRKLQCDELIGRCTCNRSEQGICECNGNCSGGSIRQEACEDEPGCEWVSHGNFATCQAQTGLVWT
eukprot:gnl/TRDRNA2_/TRDRNA2_181004_c0_seq1.p1 gnl/TRDRNA2_/TRDRNA2_181004_c0~~gnl/TRDRNA2_/TRDRNA2_181004_c0_seq1.p1  ORF type:complete len:190 (+),score=36.62 gnl/TRDRNA2_/TRDRNA2_181004_c0_seq1:51-572(+)